MSTTVFSQVIYIDPGHGYGSSVSNNPDGRTSTEIETNLAVGLKLKTLINNSCSSVVVRMSRTTNVNGWSNVSARALQAQNWNSDRLISIHCNADGDGGNDASATSTATGTETYYSTATKSTANSQSAAVHFAYAKLINAELALKGSMFKRNSGNPYLRDNLGILGRSTTACLNELGFVDNGSDKAKLLNDTWRQKFALGFFTALKSNLNLSCGTTPTNAPGTFSLTVTPECSGTVSRNVLKWTASANATSYDIYKDGNLWDSNVTSTTYTNANGVVAGATHTYYVKAKNAGATKTNNSNGTVSVVSKRCGAPGAFTLTVSTACDNASVSNKLTWTSSATATSYVVYRNGVLYASNITGTTYTNTLVTAGTSYSYYVIAKNSSSLTTTNSNGTKSITTATCNKPGSFSLVAKSVCDGVTSAINLTWTNSANATSYDVYRNGALYAANINGTSFSNTYQITAGTAFSYFVKAKNATATQTTNSNGTVNVTGLNCSTVRPFTVSASTVCDGVTSTINVTWTTSVNATSYDIYRNGNLYATNVTGNSFSNTYQIVGGTTFSYYVVAKNSLGTLQNSNGTVSIVAKKCNTGRFDVTETKLDERMSLSLYPNPTDGIINLQISKNDIATFSYIVMDINGRIVKEKSTNEVETIDISNLPSATYIVRIVIDGNEFVKQIIKK